MLLRSGDSELTNKASIRAEPNNASPLNVEAAELWDDVEAVGLPVSLRIPRPN